MKLDWPRTRVACWPSENASIGGGVVAAATFDAALVPAEFRAVTL